MRPWIDAAVTLVALTVGFASAKVGFDALDNVTGRKSMGRCLWR